MDKHIGAQFYTIRDFCTNIEDFDNSCKRISKIGYKTVQISGTPLAAKPMREVLDKYDLKCVTTHRSFNNFLTDIDEVIEYNKTLGCELCGVGMMPMEYIQSDEKLTEFITAANMICKRLEEENMYFGYHNHAMEFAKFDGVCVMDRLVDETDRELFNFIVDVYWLQAGGKNPADYIKKLGKRAIAIHFKDFSVDINKWNVPQMCHVGGGNLDWDAIIEACETAGSRWALVEQDTDWIDNNPFAALKKSYEFLNTKGFC